MSLFKLVEAVDCLLPIADQRMNEQTLDSVLVVALYGSLDGVLLIGLDNSHKADDMIVDMLGYGHGVGAVGASRGAAA